MILNMDKFKASCLFLLIFISSEGRLVKMQSIEPLYILNKLISTETKLEYLPSDVFMVRTQLQRLTSEIRYFYIKGCTLDGFITISTATHTVKLEEKITKEKEVTALRSSQNYTKSRFPHLRNLLDDT